MLLNDRFKDAFLRGGILKGSDADKDPVSLVQDPTFLSFHLDFFMPDVIPYKLDQYLAYSFAHEGLMKAPTLLGNVSDRVQNYDFTESAEDYFHSIGAPARRASLQSFKSLLKRIQNETPWYFQKVSGTEALYKVDPAVNTIKDGELTIDCLESIDQRTSLLADLYRQLSWDFEAKREILPYNMRTFRMKLHIFEMRNFTSASTIMAGMYNAESQTFLREIDPYITMRTYELGLCEFDFLSTAPNYLSESSVVDVQQATFTFKIKFKTVRLIADYPFYQYVIDNCVSMGKFPGKNSPYLTGINSTITEHPNNFYDAQKNKEYDRALPSRVIPTNAPPKIHGLDLLGQAGRSVLGALESRVNTQIGNLVNMGNSILMGNVYDNIPSINEVSQALLGFFNPDLAPAGSISGQPNTAKMGNVYDRATTRNSNAENENVYNENDRRERKNDASSSNVYSDRR